jgi:hypothetical protein
MKTPVVIIHEPSYYSPKLPPKHRFDYATEVNEVTVTRTVTVMKIRNPFMKFLLGGDKKLASLSREVSRSYPAQDAVITLEAKLAYRLFPKR